MLKHTLRTVLFLLGSAIAINGIVLFLSASFNLGILLTFLLGAALVSYSVFYNLINSRFPKYLKAIIISLFCLCIAFSSFLLIFGTTDTVTYKEDAVIVLGAGIKEDKPTRLLRCRLDKALLCYQKNPDIIIVVSGGMGPQESFTEAYVMQKYLLKKGVPQENILTEDKSTSTYENFVFSKKILDDKFDGDYSLCFVTNEYHIYRAGKIAKTANIESATHTHSTTVWHSVLPGTLRECLAVIKFWLFKC